MNLIARFFVLGVVLSAAISFAQSEPYVGGDDSRCDFTEETPLIGGDPDYQGEEDGRRVPPAPWAGYICVDLANGCPAGTAHIKDGSIVGCTASPKSGPPYTACSGTCTACSGNNLAVQLCQRDPTSSCTLQAGIGSTTTCGNDGTSSCGFVAPPSLVSDPRGCTCPTPAAYGTNSCVLSQCQS